MVAAMRQLFPANFYVDASMNFMFYAASVFI